MMNASAIFFYAIAGLILGAALLAVLSRRIFRAAIWLLGSLVGVAALYFWMELEFIAAVQIIVYVGGIVVLIIFSIFLTQRSGAPMPAPRPWQWVPAMFAVLSGCTFIWVVIDHYAFNPTATAPIDSSVSQVGTRLLSTTADGYVLPFEVVSMLLLAAMIGCIVIAMKDKKPAAIPPAAKLMIHSDFTPPQNKEI